MHASHTNWGRRRAVARTCWWISHYTWRVDWRMRNTVSTSHFGSYIWWRIVDSSIAVSMIWWIHMRWSNIRAIIWTVTNLMPTYYICSRAHFSRRNYSIISRLINWRRKACLINWRLISLAIDSARIQRGSVIWRVWTHRIMIRWCIWRGL